MSLKDDFLADIKADAQRVEPLVLPSGKTVWLRMMSGTERDAWEDGLSIRLQNGDRRPNLGNIRARWAAKILADQGGSRLFVDADAAQLGQGSAAILDLVWVAGRKLNKMDADDVKDAEKNSESGPSAASGSDSPSSSA